MAVGVDDVVKEAGWRLRGQLAIANDVGERRSGAATLKASEE